MGLRVKGAPIYTAHFILYTAHVTLHTVYSAHCTDLYNGLPASADLPASQFACTTPPLPLLRDTVYGVQFTVYGV